eukprot:3426370-Alexandrium_andersonii.AAC.1
MLSLARERLFASLYAGQAMESVVGVPYGMPSCLQRAKRAATCERKGGPCPQPLHLTTLRPLRSVRHHAPGQLVQADGAHLPLLLSR